MFADSAKMMSGVILVEKLLECGRHENVSPPIMSMGVVSFNRLLSGVSESARTYFLVEGSTPRRH